DHVHALLSRIELTEVHEGGVELDHRVLVDIRRRDGGQAVLVAADEPSGGDQGGVAVHADSSGEVRARATTMPYAARGQKPDPTALRWYCDISTAGSRRGARGLDRDARPTRRPIRRGLTLRGARGPRPRGR